MHRTAANESVASSLDLNQSGAGIHLPGCNTNKRHLPDHVALTGKQSNLSIEQLNELSSDTANFIRQRTALEHKAFDWIENELISKFLTNMAVTEQAPDIDCLVRDGKSWFNHDLINPLAID